MAVLLCPPLPAASEVEAAVTIGGGARGVKIGKTDGYRRYVPKALLGEGGMGSVYLAESKRGACALKLMHRHLASCPAHRDLFLREAELGASLAHPGLCSVIDYGRYDESFFIAQELVQGQSLKQLLLRSSDISPRLKLVALLLPWFDEICQAVQTLHEARDGNGAALECIHRDLSPDNLLITYGGQAKVVDLGLAKLAGRSEKTQDGMLKGKISYMAPELFAGEAANRSTDVWSLGVSLWELVTGQRLFDSSSDVGALNAVQRREIPRPSKLVAHFPLLLDEVLLTALDRNSSTRFESVSAFSAALREVSGLLPPALPGMLRQSMRTVFHAEFDRLQALLRGVRLGSDARAEKAETAGIKPLRADPAKAKPRAAGFGMNWLPAGLWRNT